MTEKFLVDADAFNKKDKKRSNKFWGENNELEFGTC